MLEGLFAAAAGMSAQQEQLDVVANNIANDSTTGYQGERVAFSDLLYSEVDEAGTDTTTGAGATSRVIGSDEAEGSLEKTEEPYDLAIDGRGYFEVKSADGQTLLTRDGHFTTDAEGRIVNSEGDYVQPPIKIPAGVSAKEVSISSDGEVTAAGRKLGKIALVEVTAPNSLLAAGGGKFTVTAESGETKPAKHATMIQGALEGSNVDLADELTTMVTDERSYSMGSQAVQMEGQMMSIANEIASSS